MTYAMKCSALKHRATIGYLVIALLATTISLPPRAACAGTVHEVTQVGFTFDPEQITVEPGDTVRWIWTSQTHSVTSGSECTFDGLYFDKPLSYYYRTANWLVPDIAGEVPYFCEHHCVDYSMTGLITVVPPCPEDIDGSGTVDFGDILAILSAWGNAGGPEDLDGSGTVDFGDILVVLTAWGPCK